MPTTLQDHRTLLDAAREMVEGRLPADLDAVRQAAQRVAAGSRDADRDLAEAILDNLKDGKLTTDDVDLASKLAIAKELDDTLDPGIPTPPGGRL